MHYLCPFRFLLSSDLSCAREMVVHRRISGVSISGVPWKVGHYCLYNVPGGLTRLGKVANMFHGTDVMTDEFVIFQIENIQITTYMGHYCFFSNDDQDDITGFVLWDEVSWKCKTFKLEETGRHANMALPYVSCSSRELMEFR